MDESNTSQRNRNIKSTQNNANRNNAERLNQIEGETSSDNNDVRNDEDSIPLHTPYTTSIDSMVYPSSESPDGKTNEESTNPAFPTHPRRNCPAKKNPDFYGYE
jgi:hypothetical protein